MNKIAIDLDEVLVPLLRPLAEYHGRELPKRKHPYIFREVFDCSEEESQDMIKAFYQSAEFLFLKPIDSAQPAMQNFRRQLDRMYIVTGRQDIAREQTERWVEMYFPDVFDDIILTNSFTPNEIPKVDICRALSIGCIIDDSIDTCLQCQEAGILAANFVGTHTYPWCEDSDIAMHGWRDREFSSHLF